LKLNQRIQGGAGGIVKNASKAEARALALVFVSIFVVVTAGITAVWWTEEVRMLALVLLPAAIVAALLVLYFDWRARVRRHILAERKEQRNAA
jgi:hypothetical protein